MSDQHHPRFVNSSQLIAALAARTALGTPGVLRLEPTLEGLVARHGPAAPPSPHTPYSRRGGHRHDGVSATVNDGTARVDLDIATDIAYTALAVAEAVQQRVCENILRIGLTPGPINIRILAIEPRLDTPPPKRQPLR